MSSARPHHLDSNGINRLITLRRELHRIAEISGHEKHTADFILRYLRQHSPDEIIEGIGGYGIAAVFRGNHPGKTILIRADLDALPIPETVSVNHGSRGSGVSHKCGHDGHMAIIAGLAAFLGGRRPERGRVVLLFQPAEETGEGAARIISDPEFRSLVPDMAFALHNLPGFPAGNVIVKSGPFAAGSRGLIVELEGSSSHAGQPHEGNSPAPALAHLIQVFSSVPQNRTDMNETAKVTVIHAKLGERAFGTSPGNGVVMITIRSTDEEVIQRIGRYCNDIAKAIGEAHGLKTTTRWTEIFPPTVNDPSMVEIVQSAGEQAGLEVIRIRHAFPWSEDFGHFTGNYSGALFGLGAGVDHPALHSPEYDFPDELIAAGVSIFHGIIHDLTGG